MDRTNKSSRRRTRTRPRCGFITGASSGLGRAIAVELSSPGSTWVLAARRVAELETTAERVRARGAEAQVVSLDVGNVAAVAEAVQEWDERTGGHELVLANAGLGRARPALELSWEEMQKVLEVNVLGAIATLRAGLGPMVERGGGVLAGVSSVAALRGLPMSGVYSASKAALSTYLETLRADVAGTGVRVVDLRPGFVRTPMTDDLPRTPFMIEPEEAARRAARAIERGQAVASFPLPMALAMGAVHHLPGPVWRFLATRFPRRWKERP